MSKKPKKITKKKKQKNAAHRRRQQFDAMSLLRDLQRYGLAGPLNSAITWDEPEKMSAVILDFAQPYIEKYGDDFNKLYKLVSLAIMVWNISLLPEEDHKDAIEKMAAVFGEDDPEAKQAGILIIKSLLDRKRRLFADNKRVIMNYELTTLEDGTPNLTVMSTPPK